MKNEFDENDGNWPYVFKYGENPDPIPGFNGSRAGFSLTDVDHMVGAVNGDNDGPEWVAVCLLKDGRFACVRAGCDYTGWGCQEGGSSDVADSLEGIIYFGLGDEERRRLGVEAYGAHREDRKRRWND